MSAEIDTDILELMASKVCHDLISPIGAVNNGIEFLTEMGPDAGEEVTDLIAFSAGQASAKLKAYRMAYGAGGADDSIKPEDVYNIIQEIVGAEDKITQNWDAYGELGYGDDRPNAFCKMLMCAILLGIESLPKGGVISAAAGEGGTCVVTAKGENADIRELTGEALNPKFPKAAMEPKYVHPFISGVLGQRYGYTFAMDTPEDGVVTITLTLPAS